MKILVCSIAGISSLQYCVSSEDIPGTTEQPMKAGIPARSICDDN
jgi:hypothetical protein